MTFQAPASPIRPDDPAAAMRFAHEMDDAVARLIEAGHRAVSSADAVHDPAEIFLHTTTEETGR